jgi:hypothetical protein
MKIDKWAVSVQWGEGHHYFLAYFPTEGEAEEVAEAHATQLKARYKKGAKPHVAVWRLHSDRAFGFRCNPLSQHNSDLK